MLVFGVLTRIPRKAWDSGAEVRFFEAKAQSTRKRLKPAVIPDVLTRCRSAALPRSPGGWEEPFDLRDGESRSKQSQRQRTRASALHERWCSRAKSRFLHFASPSFGRGSSGRNDRVWAVGTGECFARRTGDGCPHKKPSSQFDPVGYVGTT